MRLKVFNLIFEITGKPGKANWASSFETCAGQSQSPIDIKTKNLPQKSFKPFIFHGYDEPIKTAKVENNGHSVKVSIESLNRAQKTPGVSQIKALIYPKIAIQLL